MKYNKKLMIGVCSFIVIGIIAIVYAVFTSNLNINGTGVNRKSNFDIYFNNVSNFSTTGTASVTDPNPTVRNRTTVIEDYEATLVTPGDSVYFTFDIVNDGDYDATLTSLTLGPVKCSVNGDELDTSAQNVCSNIEYTMKYTDSNSNVSVNDTLASKETKKVQVTLTYKEFSDASKLPTSNVTISNLGIDMVYTADSEAKTNSDGSTPYVDPYSHHVGDMFTISGDSYHIIEDSPVTDDYVVALKDNPLTVSELESLGAKNIYNYSYYDEEEQEEKYTGIGYIYYHKSKNGSSNVYATSDIKLVVDAWAETKFNNGELKIVNGYSARLIKIVDLTTNLGFNSQQVCSQGRCYNGFGRTDSTPNWVTNLHTSYWAMTPEEEEYSTSFVWDVGYSGRMLRYPVGNDERAVRPVINVYKSAIQS